MPRPPASTDRLRLTFQRFDDRLRAIFHNHVRRQHAAPVYVWINHRVAPNDAAGVQDGIAADFSMVADEGAEFAQAGIDSFLADFHGHIAGKKFEIGNLDPSSQMRLVTEDGIAEVIEMRGDGVIKQKGMLDLTRI